MLLCRAVDGWVVAHFRLYDGRTTQFLGAHQTLEAALGAADEHSLAVLSAVGDRVVVEHFIARGDERRRVELVSEVTNVGPPDDVGACRQWLKQLPVRGSESGA